MSQASVTLYSTTSCVFCVMAKRLLDARAIPYQEIFMDRDEAARSQLAQRSGMKTFPQIFVGDRLVGGFRELAAAASNGQLDQLLRAE